MFRKKEKKKKPFRKTCIEQENKNFTKQKAIAVAEGGDAVNKNFFSVIDTSPQNVYGGDANATAFNFNSTKQENEVEIEEQEKKW